MEGNPRKVGGCDSLSGFPLSPKHFLGKSWWLGRFSYESLGSLVCHQNVAVESFASVVCLVGLPPWLTQLGLLQWFSFEPIAFPKVKSMVGMTFLGVQGSVVCHRDGAVDSLWRVSFEGRKSC